MATVTYAQAMAKALEEAIVADERVVAFGNYYAGLSPEQRHFDAIQERHPDRFELPPWSELANAGIAIGAATMGLRPIVDFVTASFVFQAFAQVANEAPNIAYTTQGATTAPAVFHMIGGLRGGGASQHSHRPQSLFWNTPGLLVAMPATPGDAYGLLRYLLLESQQPSVLITHAKLLGLEQEIADWEAERLEPGRGRIERDGTDITIVATSVMVSRALEAADRLADDHGISCEVLNLRTLVPYDDALVARSLARTRRVVVADESHRSAGAAAEIVARIAESHFDDLDRPPQRVTTPDTPIPFSPVLEGPLVPSTERVVHAVLEVCEA